LRWVSRDAWLIILARFLRTFAQSSISVSFAIYLDILGYSLSQIGLLVTVGSAGSALFAFVVVFIGDTFGKRRLLVGFTLIMGLAGLGFVFSDHYLLLALMSFFVGSIAISGSGPRGPMQPLEIATLPDTTTQDRRTDLFAFAGILERIARVTGALAAALPAVFVAVFAVSEIDGFRIMFVGYSAIMVASAFMYLFLSNAVGQRDTEKKWQNPFRLPSRRTIFTLAAISSVDSFATRFVFFSLVALWFKVKFGFDLAEVSYLLAGSTILSAISLSVAAWLSKRIGLLNTIVFTHIPAVVFTVILPFVPWAWLAVTLWFARGFFSQMDGPPKQSYIMAIVNRDERTAMAGVNNVAQATVGTATPWLATVMMQGLSMSAPFVAAGVLKTIYLIGMYKTFKDVHPPEELEKIERKEERTASG
jgi:MFS family permease